MGATDGRLWPEAALQFRRFRVIRTSAIGESGLSAIIEARDGSDPFGEPFLIKKFAPTPQFVIGRAVFLVPEGNEQLEYVRIQVIERLAAQYCTG